MKPGRFKSNVTLPSIDRFLISKLTSPKIIKSVLLISILSFFIISCSDEKSSGNNQVVYLTPEILCGTVQFTDGCSPQLDTLISFGFALIHHMTFENAEYTFDKVIV